MDLTVGVIEDKLRKFPKETTVELTCGCCHHGAIGNESMLSIEDNTHQNYGYITLNFLDASQSYVELSQDKEEFYKGEIAKLNKIIEGQKNKLERYEDCAKSIKSNADWILK